MMRAATRQWRALAAAMALLACGGAAQHAAAGGQPDIQSSGRLIVRMRPGVVTAMDADGHGLRYTRPAGIANTAVYSITDGKSPEEKLEEMMDNPAIEFAEPDYRVRVNATAFSSWQPDDSLLNAQWHHIAIGSNQAWDISRGSSQIKVCHVDSGVRVDHPDLVGRVLMGWNLVPEVQEFDQSPPSPGDPHYSSINDTYGHGTHTAGIIAAVGNNALGVVGLAMDVRLLVCRFIWDDGFGSISDALECLRLCREQGATISSNSWGGVPHSKAIETALHEMEEAGMLFVVASGNQKVNLDDRPTFPASLGLDHMVVVGASGNADVISPFSNYGAKTVHLLSPGESILSTTYNNWYGTMDGTSMACPLVAGAAALLQSAALSYGVTLTCGETKRLLLSTVDPCPAGESTDATITGGRLNVGAAMHALLLLLQERGLPALPGASLESGEADELQRRLLENPWGQELLGRDSFKAAERPQAGVPAASPADNVQQSSFGLEQAGAALSPTAGEARAAAAARTAAVQPRLIQQQRQQQEQRQQQQQQHVAGGQSEGVRRRRHKHHPKMRVPRG